MNSYQCTASVSFLLSGSERRERMVVHAHLTNDVETNVHESYLRSVVQCRGKMFISSLMGSQDSMLTSRVYGNVLSPNPAGELKLSADELIEVWLLDRAWND